MSMRDQSELAGIMSSALLLMRMTNPTTSRSSYGNPMNVFGNYRPTDWGISDVQSLLNINGIIADGLHNLPLAMIGQEPNIDDQLERLASDLDQTTIPASIYRMPIWAQFCRSLAGRTLGNQASVSVGEAVT